MANGNNTRNILFVGGGIALLAFLLTRSRRAAARTRIGANERRVVTIPIIDNPTVILSNLRIPDVNLFRLTATNQSNSRNSFYINGFLSVVEGGISNINDIKDGENLRRMIPLEFIFNNSAAFILDPGELINVDFTIPENLSPGRYDLGFEAGQFDDTASNPFLTRESSIIASNNFTIP